MERKISKKLETELTELCSISSDNPLFWEKFYKWCIKSYRMDSVNRYSISELGKKLKKHNVSNAKDLIVAYFHILYSLALFEGKTIYGEGFNI